MGPIVVLSPHSDDGVLSIGASMAKWARAGRAVELLTVLALDPASNAACGGWDRRAGFRTEGEASRARRREDQIACSRLGVTPSWLPFGSVDYDRHGDEDEVANAIEHAVDGAAVVLLPGAPLTHPDHAWLSELVARRLPAFLLGRYAEQPYLWNARETAFTAVDVGLRDRVAKWHAVRAYRSQLPLLGMHRRPRRGPLRLSLADECVDLPL